VIKAITFRAEAVIKPGSHSSSADPNDFEDVSTVDRLAVKLYKERQIWFDQVEVERLQTAMEKERKRNVSAFLVPPPSALGNHNVIQNRPISSKLHNNNLEVCDLVDEDEAGKENVVVDVEEKKKKKKPVLAGADVGSLFLTALAKPDPSMDLVARLMADFQKKEVAIEERRLKAEERVQHLKLLEMLHSGKISKEIHDAMKP
jgi:hypothetical protein